MFEPIAAFGSASIFLDSSLRGMWWPVPHENLLVAAENERISVIDVTAGRALVSHSLGAGFECMAVAGYGYQGLLLSGAGGRMRVFDADEGALLDEVAVGEEPLVCGAWLDGESALVCTQSGRLFRWHRAEGVHSAGDCGVTHEIQAGGFSDLSEGAGLLALVTAEPRAVLLAVPECRIVAETELEKPATSLSINARGTAICLTAPEVARRGGVAFTGSGAGTVVFWEPSTGSLRTRDGHEYGGLCSTSASGSEWITGGRDGWLRRWHNSGDAIESLDFLMPGPIASIALREFASERAMGVKSTTRSLAVALDSGALWILPEAAGRDRNVAVIGPITALTFDEESGLLAAGGVGGAVAVFDVSKRQVTAVLPLHSSQVQSIAPWRDGMFLTTSFDYRVRLAGADTAGKHPFSDLRESDLELSPDGSHVCGYLSETQVGVWDRRGKRVWAGECPDTWAFAALSSSGQRVAMTTMEGDVLVWDVAARAERPLKIASLGSTPSAFKISSDGSHVAVSKPMGETLVIEVESGRIVCSLKSMRSEVGALAFSADMQFLARGERDDGVIEVVRLPNGKTLARHEHGKSVMSLTFLASSAQLAVGDASGRVVIYEVR